MGATALSTAADSTFLCGSTGQLRALQLDTVLVVVYSEPQAFVFIRLLSSLLTSRRQGPVDVRLWELDIFSYRTACGTCETARVTLRKGFRLLP